MSVIQQVGDVLRRAVDSFAASAEAEVNPPCNFVGMCRCGVRLRTEQEHALGECTECATRWW